MYQVTKKFANFPFAHRQHNHQGHCQNIHGHNWDFEIKLTCETLDANGFVADFGAFKPFREWLNYQFDHTLVLNATDPKLMDITRALEGMSEIRIVENCGAEGLAKYVSLALEIFVKKTFARGVRVVQVTVHEDEKNSATYEA